MKVHKNSNKTQRSFDTVKILNNLISYNGKIQMKRSISRNNLNN